MTIQINDNEKEGTPNILRVTTLVALLVGAIGSAGFTLYAGRSNESVLLIALFIGWVLSPFAGLMYANRISKRWSPGTRTMLYFLMLLLSSGSLLCYSGLIKVSSAKPAFIFLVVPFISWLLIAIVIFIARKRRNNIG